MKRTASFRNPWLLRLVTVIAAICVFTSTAAIAQTTPLKPPSVPLITRGPYVSTWLANTTAVAPGTWPTFWAGMVKAITGMAYIDGKSYQFFGAPGLGTTMTQTALNITPTQSTFQFNGGGVTITVDFLSPIEATDIRRLSMPLSDIITTAKSSDGNSHSVKVYFDISGEWAHGDPTAIINWAPETINRNADGSGTSGTLSAWTVTPNAPSVLTETNQYADWGTALWATVTSSNLTTMSGQDSVVRGQFASSGTLNNSNDTNQPRAIDNDWPVFAFDENLGTVKTTASSPFTLIIGHVRNPAISYLGSNVAPLWLSYWSAYENMLAFAYNDSSAAVTRANALDTNITAEATAIGGAHYAALAAISLRQAFAGTELVGTSANPWLMLKEISSDGNVSTVDVCYPSMPALLALNPELVRYLIAPLIAYAESGNWPEQYAEHDLGSAYPVANGHNDGGGENMPVEETANMLIMADAYMRAVPPGEATAYAQAHYTIFKQWANYLLTTPSGVPYCNALDPQYQNQTDDFLGSIAHSSNLALKGIIAVGAMGQIAGFDGNSGDQSTYLADASGLISQWATLSQNSSNTHLLLTYKEAANAYSPDTTSEPDSAWSLKYNEFPDKLLGLDLVPEPVLTEEAAWYKTLETATGIPLDYRADTTKSDWQLWTAAGTDDPTLRQNLFDEVYDYENTTPAGVPSPDLYHTTSTSTSFQARPVLGGYFATIARNYANNTIANGVHTLTPACAPTERLDDNAAGTANGNKIQIWQAYGDTAQQWDFANTGGNNYNLAVNIGPYCLDGGAASQGTPVQLWGCNGTADQSWTAAAVNGGYTFKSAQSGLCVDVNGGGDTNGTVVQSWACNGTVAQTWMLDYATPTISNGTHTLTPACAPGERLDDNAAGTADGNKIQIWQAYGDTAQEWNFGSVGGNGFNIAVNLGPYCLDGGAAQVGTPTQLWSCNGTADQEWNATAVYGGFTLASGQSGLCLDVTGASSANGAVVESYTCNGTSAQTWAVD